MLLQLKKINILNEGYGKTTFSLEKVYVNPSHIISVRDYEGIKQFLIKEGAEHMSSDNYSLVKINIANDVEEMIVLGASEEIYSRLQSKTNRQVLNG